MRKFWDHIGIILSCTCIVHCLLLPILIVLLQFDLHVAGFHEMMVVMTILISGHALWHGFKKHCKHIVLAFGVIGVNCMAVALLAPAIEVMLTTVGALLVLCAHILNLRESNCCVNSDNETGVCHETHD